METNYVVSLRAVYNTMSLKDQLYKYRKQNNPHDKLKNKRTQLPYEGSVRNNKRKEVQEQKRNKRKKKDKRQESLPSKEKEISKFYIKNTKK